MLTLEYLAIPEDVDTFKCPKCKAIWRLQGSYEYGDDLWQYDGSEYCPNGCTNFLGFKVKGKIQNKQ